MELVGRGAWRGVRASGRGARAGTCPAWARVSGCGAAGRDHGSGANASRARLVLVLGVATGLSMFCGGVLAAVPVLAVAVIGLLGIVTALLAARSRLGQVAMTLTLPLVAIGFSYT